MSEPVAKTSSGRFFEDFRLGETIVHATPRTIRAGDASLYSAVYGPRFAVQSSDAFARAIGYPEAPIDDLLVFRGRREAEHPVHSPVDVGHEPVDRDGRMDDHFRHDCSLGWLPRR